MNQKENNIEKYKIDLELYIGTINLSSNNTVLNTTKDEINTTVLNNSYRTYLPGEFRIGVIAQKNIIIKDLLLEEGEEISKIELPDGKSFLYHLKISDEILFPNSYTQCQLLFDERKSKEKKGKDKYRIKSRITYRIFTDAGTRDYPVELDYFDQSQFEWHQSLKEKRNKGST